MTLGKKDVDTILGQQVHDKLDTFTADLLSWKSPVSEVEPVQTKKKEGPATPEDLEALRGI